MNEQQDAMICEAAQVSTREVFDERRDLVMSKAAFARFAEALDAPAQVVPEMAEMFRLPRIPEA